jgi:flavin-dependent dehydrogenase
MKTFDVLVVGAGLAGLQCAELLSARGLHVLIIDRKESLSDGIHTTGIFVRRTLEEFSLPTNCLGPAVRHVTLYSPGLRALELESPHDEFRVGRMGPLYLHCLKRCLDAGAEWMPKTKFIKSEEANDGSIIEVEREGLRYRFFARYLIGADGARSRVAACLGLDENAEWIVGVEDVLRNVPLEGPPRFHCFLDPELAPGYIAWVVHDGEECHIGTGGYTARFDPLKALMRFQEVVGERVLDLTTAFRSERRGGRIPVGGVLRNIANKRGLLVGDAAGAVSPLTAGGLDPCLRLSSFAAQVVESYLLTGDEQRLEAYSGDLFRSHFQKRLWMRHVIRRIRHPLLLELACRSMQLPIMKSFAWNVFFGRGSFPDVEAAQISRHADFDLAEL